MKFKKVVLLLLAVILTTFLGIFEFTAAIQLAGLGEDVWIFTALSIILMVSMGIFFCGLSVGRWKAGTPRYIGIAVFFCFFLTAIGTWSKVSKIDFVEIVSSIQK